MTIHSTILAGPGATGGDLSSSADPTIDYDFLVATCPASRAARASSSCHASRASE